MDRITNWKGLESWHPVRVNEAKHPPPHQKGPAFEKGQEVCSLLQSAKSQDLSSLLGKEMVPGKRWEYSNINLFFHFLVNHLHMW